MRVLVTGATGFVGGPVCKALARGGHEVIAALRSSRAPGPSGSGIARALTLGDFTRETNWGAALEGADAVIHLAGRAHVMHDDPAQSERLYEEGNVGVLEGLAITARRAGIRRFVFVSSIKVNGEETPPGHFFKSTDQPAPLDAYGRTKLKAEQRLRDIAEGSPLEWVIVRPPLIYGPKVRGNLARLIRLVDRGMPLPFGSISNERDLLYVGALADLLVKAVAHPAAANKVFLASDGAPLSTPDLIRAIAAAAEKPARLLPFPPQILAGALALLGKGEEARRLIGNLRIDDAETRRLLDWDFRCSRQTAWQEMVQHQSPRAMPAGMRAR